MSLQTGRAGRLVVAMAVIALAPLVVSAQDYVFRLAHVTSDKEPLQAAMEEFVKNVEARTEGRVAFQIFAIA